MKILIRNFLVVLGIYWLSMWVNLPIATIHRKITTGIIYSGLLGGLLMHVVSSIHVALVSFGGGILCTYILEETSHKYWLLLLALLYTVMSFTGFHYVRTPELTDRIFQLVQSIIPSITCYLGGITISKTHKQK